MLAPGDNRGLLRLSRSGACTGRNCRARLMQDAVRVSPLLKSASRKVGTCIHALERAGIFIHHFAIGRISTLTAGWHEKGRPSQTSNIPPYPMYLRGKESLTLHIMPTYRPGGGELTSSSFEVCKLLIDEI